MTKASTTGIADQRSYEGSVEQISGAAPADDQKHSHEEFNTVKNTIDQHAPLIDAACDLLERITAQSGDAESLKNLRDDIESLTQLLASDDTDLDTAQERVDRIKQLIADVESIDIVDVSGLRAELDALALSTQAAADAAAQLALDKENTGVAATLVATLEAALRGTGADTETLRKLRDDIESLTQLLASDDTDLDTAQERVDRIKQLIADVESIDIVDVSGLRAELDALAFLPTLRTHEIAQELSRQSNGSVVSMGGLWYLVDSSRVGALSVTDDLGVDGLAPYGIAQLGHFGGSAGQDALSFGQRALDYGLSALEVAESYTLSAMLVGRSDIDIFSNNGGGFTSSMTAEGDILYFENESNFSVKRLKLVGTGIVGERGINVRASGVNENASSNFKIEDNTIKGCYTGIKMGITPNSSTPENMIKDGKVSGNDIMDSTSFGIVCFASVSDVEIFSNTVDGGDSVGISSEDRSNSSTDAAACNRISIHDNTVRNILLTGIKIEGSYDSSATDNTVVDIGAGLEGSGSAAGTGISVRTISRDPASENRDTRVSGNVIVRARDKAVQVLGAARAVITGNRMIDFGAYRVGDTQNAVGVVIQNSNANGVALGSTDCVVENNTMALTGNVVVGVSDFVKVNNIECDRNIIRSNLMSDNGENVDEIDDRGANTSVSGNTII